MSKISKTNQYAVLWLYQNNKNISEISKELKLTENQVNSVIQKFNTEIAKVPITTKVRTSKDFMIRKTSGKENNTVSIMTKEASEMNDEAKKNNVLRVKNNTSNIHKIS